jgi:hypothetical protein
VNNRRSDYRHHFAPDDRLRVDLSAAGCRVATGQIIDMCVEGIAVELGGRTLRIDPAKPISAHFAIPHGLRRFTVPAAVVHAEETAEGKRVGLHFLPPDDPRDQEERDQALWVFLLDEQRHDIWRLRAQAGRGGAPVGTHR